MSDAARDLLRELLAEALANRNGRRRLSTAPVAAVHRPSTWAKRSPPRPARSLGNRLAIPSSRFANITSTAPRTEAVRLENDADLAAFVRMVLEHGDAIREGRLRFTLGSSSSSPPAGVMRVAHGAVTDDDQEGGGGRRPARARAGSLLTPLAREKARALGIDIERER